MKRYTFEIYGLDEATMMKFKNLADEEDLDYELNEFEVEENEI